MSLAGHALSPDPTRASRPVVRESEARPALDRRFEYIVLSVYAVLVSVLASLHEPWKDETQTWRLAIDSDGVRALVRNSRYEGHPLLFHLMLQALGHLSRSWWAAVVLHVIIACLAAWVVLRYAPFTRLEKVLVVAGYFPAYEYAVIVRPYGLGMLLAFAACAMWSAQRRRPIVVVLLLVLLANTSVFGMLLALAAGATFLLDWVWPDDAPSRISPKVLAVGAITAALALAVVWLVARQVVPPADATFKGNGAAREGVTLWKVAAGLLVPFRAMVPVAKIGEGTVQWNRWLFEPYVRSTLLLDIVLSAMVVLVGALVASRRRTALFFFLASTLGLTAFFLLFVEGGSRHHGHVAIGWIMAAWLAREGRPTVWPATLRPLVDRIQRLAPRLFVLSLIPMVATSAEFAVGDALRPFSDARGLANFLVAHGLRDVPLIGLARADAEAVSALLDRPMIIPSEGRTSTFVMWGAARVELANEVQLNRVTDTLFRTQCRALLVSTRPRELPGSVATRARLIYETSYRPMSKDRYRVWLMQAPSSPRCPAGSTVPTVDPVP